MKKLEDNTQTQLFTVNLKSLSRDHYLAVVDVAIESGELRFASQAVLNWLGEYPGDLLAQFMYGRLLYRDGKPLQSLAVVEGVCASDPLFTAAQQLLVQVLKVTERNPGQMNQAQSLLYVLSEGKKGLSTESWCPIILKARNDLRKGSFHDSITTIEDLISSKNIAGFPLLHVTYLDLLNKSKEKLRQPDLQYLEEIHKEFPSTVYFMIQLADCLMSWGEHTRAVSLLNQAVSKDTDGQVVRRLWGPHHRYHSIWPKDLSLPLESSIPYQVSIRLGWNILPAGKYNPPQKHSKPDSSKPISTASEMQYLQQKSEEIQQANNQYNLEAERSISGEVNNRTPNYVILSIRKSLEDKFGNLATRDIHKEMDHLSQVMSQLNGWKSIVFLADDQAKTTDSAIQPAKPGDPWSIKLSIIDLEKKLNKEGERIGAILLVGGPDIIPFHHLPNPVNDPDDVIPSDNPYASFDENYFIPEWPVGRVADGEVKTDGVFSDPEVLIENLRQISRSNVEIRDCASPFKQWIIPIKNGFRYKKFEILASYGYVAAVWKNVSDMVYSPIGKPKSLISSPPFGKGKNHSTPNKKIRSIWSLFSQNSNKDLKPPPKIRGNLAYFNLHGVQESGEWFGQKATFDSSDFPDYPVALHPDDIPMPNRSNRVEIPQVIFSEACFGAHILDKAWNETISLSLIHAGSKAFIGSTSMAYGSVGTPLIAADLLGHSFWSFLKQGYPVGEALLRAKINLVQTMHERQGHLDGEDQKTLISFVLYGDPLAYPISPHKCPTAPWRPPQTFKAVKTINDGQYSEELPPDVVAHVKTIVSRYLPGMMDAKFAYGLEGEVYSQWTTQPSHQGPAKKRDTRTPQYKRITLSKQITRANRRHTQIAHITLADNGKLVKLVVSR